MSDDFDPYYKWLGIPARDQPPNHYRLLGVMLFEVDPEVIESAADRQMAHVRSFQGGKHAAESQKVLNDLSAAKLCLLSADKKAAYDQTLKAKLAGAQAVAQAPAASSPVKAAPKPAATPVKPLRVAQATALQRPTPAQTSPEDSLGFDPLAQSTTKRHRKRKTAAQQPALLVGAGAVVIAVIGLVWAIASGSGDPPTELAAKTDAPADKVPQGTDQATAPQRPTPQTPRSKNVGPSAADKAGPDRPAPDDSDNDSTSEPIADVDAAADDVMDSVMPNDTDDGDLDSAEPDDAPVKAAVPNAEALKAAIAEIQTLLKADFSAAKKPDQRIALAEKLLGLAADSDVPTERYALLSEAQRLAVSAGDSALAMQAIDAEAEEFTVQRLELAADMLDSLASKEMPAAARKELVDVVMPLIDEAAAAGQFKLARRLATIGLAAARKISTTDAAKALAQQAHDLVEQEKLAEAADAAGKLLAEKPDDAEAHLTLGKYLCLVVGDWDAGLPHLKQGSDPPLRSIAELELAGLDATADQVKLGDQWWDLADEQKGVEKDRYRARAGHWYEQAIGELNGLSKAKVEKRLADLPALPKSAPSGKPATAAVYYLSDLNAEDVQIFPGEPLRGKYDLKIEGIASPHALLTHPIHGKAHAAYQLPKGCRAFLGKVGVSNYIEPWRAVGPLVFRVIADGQELWRSRPFQSSKDTPQDFNIALRNASKLELVVDCGGHDNYSHGVWFEPRVITSGASNGKSPAGEKGHLATGKWIDLLPLADPVQQHLEAAWRRTAAGLHVEKPETPIQIPRQIAGDYTLHVEFTRTAGNDAVYVLFPTAPTQTAMVISGWNGQASGLDGVNGRAARDGVTAVQPGTLDNDHRYSIDITVRRVLNQVSVDVDLDRKAYVRWKGDPSALGFTTHWMPRWETIGLAANEPTIFHAVKLKMLADPAAIAGAANPRIHSRSVNPAGGTRTDKSKDGLLPGAVLIATFDEPTIIHKNGEVRVRDLSGKQKPGLVVGSESVPGKVGGALSFEKIGDHVDWGEDPSLNSPTLTACAWIKPSVHSNQWADILSKYRENSGGTQAGFILRLNWNTPDLTIGVGDGLWHEAHPTSTVPLGAWTHVAATYDGKTQVVFVDAQLAVTIPMTGAIVESPVRCAVGMAFWKDDRQFFGLIDEVALFNRALSAEEVQQIYELGKSGKSLTAATSTASLIRSGAGNVPDSRPGSEPAKKVPAGHKAASGLLQGAVLIATFDEPTIIRKNGSVRVRDLSGTQKPGLVAGAGFAPGKSGQALILRKASQHIDWGNDPSLNPAKFTFCAWIKPAAHNNVLRDVFSKHSEDRGRTGLVVRLDADRPKFGIGIGDGNWHFLEQGISVPIEQWVHLAATHDENTSSIYINNQLAKNAGSDGPVAASIERCYIGSTPGHDELQFYGLIDEVALFDRALSAAEVGQIFQLGEKGKSLASAGKK